MSEMSDTAKNVGDQANNSDALDIAVRIGLVAYGLVYLVVAWLALQLALGDQSGSADTTGALHELAQHPFGIAAIWLVAIGMLFLVVWRLLDAAAGHRDEKDTKKRVAKSLMSIGKAAIYSVLGWSAFKIATGAGSSGGGGTDSTTAKIMDLPAGQVLVGFIGLAIVGYGGAQVIRGWTEKFLENLDAEGKSGDTGRAYVIFGKVGYIAKGISLFIVGGLFFYASVTHRPKESGGLDQALHKVLQQPYGQVLLVVMALGIGCYGLFCFARARHLSR